MILTHGANSIRASLPIDPIPLNGTLTHQWNFNGQKNWLVDSVNRATISAATTPQIGSAFGFLDITYTRGVMLNVEVKVNDYIEAIFYLEDGVPSDHMRLINKTSSQNIDDTSSFFIWRGSGFYYWASYFGGWYTSISNDYYGVIGKKLGLFLKSGGYMDVFLDGIRIAYNFQNNWDSIYTNKKYYALGVTTTNWTTPFQIECQRVRIFRNCSYPV